jgi:HK97 family phage major capsid protein
MKSAIDYAREERAQIMEPANAIVAAAEAEGRGISDDELTQVRNASAAAEALDARIAELSDLAERNARAAAEFPKFGGARVTREARTYSPEAERRDGISFLADVAATMVPASGFVAGAAERIARHVAEDRSEGRIETRAAGTGAFAGLVVPQYLTDMVAPAVAAMRPTADIAAKHELPAVGMTVNISRITTATSATLQASENTAVSETNIDDTLLSPAVLTASGQQTLSLQALQRGVGTEAVTVGDLVKRYHTVLNSTIINQATTGLDAAAGVSVTYTDATPTGAELYPKLFDLIQQVQTAVFLGVSHFIMHPRRWSWLASQVGTSWPFLQVNGAGNQTAGSYTGTGVYNNGTAGTLAGVPVILDASIATNFGAGTNEDRIYGVTASELHLWEDPAAPVYIRAEQPAAASLGVLFVVYGYFAYTAQRYASAHGKISGTGLITPTF